MPSGTDVHVGFFWPQSKQTYKMHPVSAAVSRERWRGKGREALTLLAGFVLSFSKILSDCCLVARPLMMTVFLVDFVCW